MLSGEGAHAILLLIGFGYTLLKGWTCASCSVDVQFHAPFCSTHPFKVDIGALFNIKLLFNV